MDKVLIKGNGDGLVRVEQEPIHEKVAIENFLGIPLPNKIVLPDGGFVLLDSDRLGERVLEQKPFFLIERAVGIGTDYVLAVAAITEKHCAGHFPGRPVVPLIRMCEAAAQAGVIVVALSCGRDHVPIACGSASSKALTRKFIEPPVTLLIEARKVDERFGAFFIVDSKMYAEGIGVAQLKGIEYLIPPRSRISST